MKNLELLVTLWPTFPHFARFANDDRLSGIRLNGAMMKPEELDVDFKLAAEAGGHMPLYYDVKGRQLRITEVHPYQDHLEIKLNRPIEVKTPTTVLFKAGEDYAKLNRVEGGGRRLVFDGGPYYNVGVGESLHIRDPTLKVNGLTLPVIEVEKTIKARQAGFNKFFLSYVEDQRDIDQLREYVGDSEIIAKIENKAGLEYVARQFKPQEGLHLMAACGDLFVEVDRPHHILDALRLIIDKDPEGYIGSRILLSLVNRPVPSFSDLGHVAWLRDIGYKKMMLCDELCLKEDMLSRAVNVFDSFRQDYRAGNEVAGEKKGFLSRLLGRYNGSTGR